MWVGFFWICLEFIEWCLNLKVIQIQTIFQNLYSNICKTLTSNSGQFSLKPTPRPSKPIRTTQPSSPATSTFLLFLFSLWQPGPTRQPYHFPPPHISFPAADQPHRATLAGMAGPPAGTHAEPGRTREPASGIPRGKDPNAICNHAKCVVAIHSRDATSVTSPHQPTRAIDGNGYPKPEYSTGFTR
jgi:hypothetical protein